MNPLSLRTRCGREECTGRRTECVEPIALVAELAGAITILVPNDGDVTFRYLFPLLGFSSPDTPELPVFVD